MQVTLRDSLYAACLNGERGNVALAVRRDPANLTSLGTSPHACVYTGGLSAAQKHHEAEPSRPPSSRCFFIACMSSYSCPICWSVTVSVSRHMPPTPGKDAFRFSSLPTTYRSSSQFCLGPASRPPTSRPRSSARTTATPSGTQSAPRSNVSSHATEVERAATIPLPISLAFSIYPPNTLPPPPLSKTPPHTEPTFFPP